MIHKRFPQLFKIKIDELNIKRYEQNLLNILGKRKNNSKFENLELNFIF